MAKRRSKEATGMAVRFLEEPEEQPRGTAEDSLDGNGINLSRSCSDLHERTTGSDTRLHHTMPGRLRPQLSCECQLMSDRAHKIGRACWSGGWQNTILNRRRKGLVPSNEEDEIQEMTQAMQTDPKFMADTIDGVVMRRNTFREMTKSLRLRRELRQRLSLVQPSYEKVPLAKSIKYYFSLKMIKLKRTMTQLFHDYSLWHGDINRIEGIFGRNVGSFFYFLRDNVIMNLLLSLMVCGYLLAPQLLRESTGYAQSNETVSFGALDLITGAGWFSISELYYGGYSSGNFSLLGDKLQYDMTYAYFFTISICHMKSLVTLLLRVCSLYKTHYITLRGDGNCNFTRLVFTGWDFRITDDNAGNVKRRSVYNELVEGIQELIDDEEVDSFYRLLRRRLIQLFIWMILMAFVLLLSWGMYVFLTKEYTNLVHQDMSYLKESFNFLIFPMLVTTIMFVVPIIFDNIGKHELHLKKRTSLYVTLIRVTILGLVILAVLFLFWYGNSPGLVDEMPALKINGENHVKVFHYRDPLNITTTCWETALGQEIYRLVMVDFIFIIAICLLVDPLRALLVKKGKLKENHMEFNISGNILHIIYNQTLLWAGLFFCPLLPVIICVKFICIFYLHKFTLTRNLRPSERPWRASQSETLFNSLALFSLILAIFSYGFIIVRGYSSDNCGPFREYPHYIDFLWSLSMDSERVILQVVKWLFKPVTIAISIGLLSILVVCVKNVAEGRIEMVTLLQHQIQMEIQDKRFYLSLMDQAQRGDYRPGTPLREQPSTSNWERDLDSTNLSKRASFIFTKGNEDLNTNCHNGLVNEDIEYEDSAL